MEFKTYDEMFVTNVANIMANGLNASPRGMAIKEELFARNVLLNPRSRGIMSEARSTDLWYAFGELFWYLSRSQYLVDIQYYSPSIGKYSDDGITLNSAYGYVMGEKYGDQIGQAIRVLRLDRDSRQSIIVLRHPNEVFDETTKDQICTIALQLFIRNEKLHMGTVMRSNDLFVGFVFDVFCFTMIQEFIAACLGVEVGPYTHISNSLHIYSQHFDVCSKLSTGQMKTSDIVMDRMTFSPDDPAVAMMHICETEKKIRNAKSGEHASNLFDEYATGPYATDYWSAILLVLLAKKYYTLKKFNSIDGVCMRYLKSMNQWDYHEYLKKKLDSIEETEGSK